MEQAYINTMDREVKRQMYDKLTSSQIPCLVFSRGQNPDDDLLEYCNYYGVPCLVSDKTTSSLMAEVHPEVHFYKVDIDEEMDLASRFGVMSVPTLLYFKRGEIVNKTVGLISPADLENAIAKSK